MALGDIQRALGVDRVIWIDDVFGDPVVDLATLALEHAEVEAEFPELSSAFALGEYGDVDGALTQAIHDMNPDRRSELRLALLKQDAEEGPAQELAEGAIESVCNYLGVANADRWTFSRANERVPGLAPNDANVAYLIDLKEGGGQARRGLDIINLLQANCSNGVAFILTHETAASGEAALERELVLELGDAGQLAPPITVVSKNRVVGENLEAALAVALKRAGLRRALYQVLVAATSCAADAYSKTAIALMSIEPERLQAYVYDRGYKEGVSELNVVERALTAGASKKIRTFFGIDPVVLSAAESLRSLQEILLDHPATDAGPILTELRNAEVWDDGDTLNSALSPLANGDVFRLDEAEPGFKTAQKFFVLLGQPCDLMLRQNGTRVSDLAMFVPLRELQPDGTPLPDPNEDDMEDHDKSPLLPFILNGRRFKLNLRDMAYARLAILDLACFRRDGSVRVEADHTPPTFLLASGKIIYPARTSPADAALAAKTQEAGADASLIDSRLLLTMSEGKLWENIRLGRKLDAFAPGRRDKLAALPDRVTWHLQREGRIRAPFSTFIFERALRLLSRRAFDSDYSSD